MRFFTNVFILLHLVIGISACSFNNDDSEYSPNLRQREKGLNIEIKHLNKSGWQPSHKIKATTRNYLGDIGIKINFADLEDELEIEYGNANKKYNFCFLKFELTVNGKPFIHCIERTNSTYDTYDSLKNCYSTMVDLDFFKEKDLILPIYKLRDYRAGELLDVKIHVWQDKLFTKKNRRNNENGTSYSTRDSLVKPLINSEFSFRFKMPEIYKTQFIIDSLFLQNDSVWSPKHSDFVLWGSSYPDLYVAVVNEYSQTTDETHVEKTTSKFLKPDTISLFHYRNDSNFSLEIRDKDGSGFEEIGRMRRNVSSIEDNKQIETKFNQLDRFYFKKKFIGKVN